MSSWDWLLDGPGTNKIKTTEDIKPVQRTYALTDLDQADYEDAKEYKRVPEDQANLVTSKVDSWKGNKHAPVLDIDIPHKLVPSSTEGHSHLYLDVECEWNDYVAFLNAAAKIGILEPGFVDASINRGFTSVRVPGLTKGDPRNSLK